MKYQEVELMVKAIVECADHDLAKELNPDTAEEPEFAEDFLGDLVGVAMNFVTVEE